MTGAVNFDGRLLNVCLSVIWSILTGPIVVAKKQLAIYVSLSHLNGKTDFRRRLVLHVSTGQYYMWNI